MKDYRGKSYILSELGCWRLRLLSPDHHQARQWHLSQQRWPRTDRTGHWNLRLAWCTWMHHGIWRRMGFLNSICPRSSCTLRVSSCISALIISRYSPSLRSSILELCRWALCIPYSPPCPLRHCLIDPKVPPGHFELSKAHVVSWAMLNLLAQVS